MSYSNGKIHSQNAFAQKVLFDGMRYVRGITPTDIECFVDFGNKLFVIGELKRVGAPIYHGQRLCIERACDAIAATKKCIAFIARHDTPPPDAVLANTAIVEEYRWNGAWKKPSRQIELGEAIRIISERHA